MKLVVLCLAFFSAVSAGIAASPEGGRTGAIKPLTNAHAHNDYEHTRPLFDALDNGFCSIEADIYLIDGNLLVAHERKDTRPDRTLQALYLDPLRERAKKNGGRIYAKGPVSITLLIDVKTDAEPTYAVLRGVLAQYKDILTIFRPDGMTPGAVTAVISGDRPSVSLLASEPVRYAAYDGRLSDLDKGISPNIMPLVSQDWGSLSSWQGASGTTLSEEDQKKIQDTVAKVHQQGYRLRFWGTPDTPTTWQALRDLKVDWINTDNLVGLREFLLSGKNHP